MTPEMFSLPQVPSELLPAIFNKMSSVTFHMAPQLDRRCHHVFQRNLNRFSHIPIYYLDKLQQKTTITNRVTRLAAEYVNAILRHVQDSSFLPEDLIVEYDYTENMDVPTALEGLNTTMFYRMDDESCAFASAKSYHIFPVNFAVFTIKNRKNVEYLVKLRKNGLFVERAPEGREHLLYEAWDATRNSSSYPMPDILHL